MKRCALLAFALALVTNLGAPPAWAVVVSAPIKTVTVGDAFSVDISVSDAAALESFQFDLGFLPSIVRADTAGASAGAALPGDWFFLSPGTVDDTNGDILGVAASGSPFSGSGAIASFQFTALALGVSPLDLSSVFLNFSDSGFTVLDGAITVVAQIPEPGTLALLASGFAFFGARRLRQSNRAV